MTGRSRSPLRSARQAIETYVEHDDPLARGCNLIALVVVVNQPFYPLYVYWLVGHDVAATLLTFLSTPFFAAVPLVARWRSSLGRAMLPLAGMANTALATKVLGQASAVEIFLLPCALIAAAFFRRSERAISMALLGVVLVVFLGLDGRYGQPTGNYTIADYRKLVELNVLSAGTLVVFVGLVLSAIREKRS